MISYRLIRFHMINSNENITLLTPKQVADQLQLSLITVYTYIKSKQLVAIRLGRSYRITEKDLNNFLKLNRTSL